MTFQLLMCWWNLIYLIPLALIYLIIYMITGLSTGDADAGGGHDAGAEAGHDIAGHDAGHEASHDSEHESEQAAHVSPGFSILSLLGVGRAPLSVIMMVLLMIWSLVGIILNRMMFAASGSVAVTVAVSVPVALVSAFLGTALLSRLIQRVFPSTETYVRRKSSLVGLAGEAVYDMTTGFGTVQVRDQSGDLHELPCQTKDAGQGPPKISRGQKVVLYDYDNEKGVFYVTPFEAEKQ